MTSQSEIRNRKTQRGCSWHGRGSGIPSHFLSKLAVTKSMAHSSGARNIELQAASDDDPQAPSPLSRHISRYMPLPWASLSPCREHAVRLLPWKTGRRDSPHHLEAYSRPYCTWEVGSSRSGPRYARAVRCHRISKSDGQCRRAVL